MGKRESRVIESPVNKAKRGCVFAHGTQFTNMEIAFEQPASRICSWVMPSASKTLGHPPGNERGAGGFVCLLNRQGTVILLKQPRKVLIAVSPGS